MGQASMWPSVECLRQGQTPTGVAGNRHGKWTDSCHPLHIGPMLPGPAYKIGVIPEAPQDGGGAEVQ